MRWVRMQQILAQQSTTVMMFNGCTRWMTTTHLTTEILRSQRRVLQLTFSTPRWRSTTTAYMSTYNPDDSARVERWQGVVETAPSTAERLVNNEHMETLDVTSKKNICTQTNKDASYWCLQKRSENVRTCQTVTIPTMPKALRRQKICFRKSGRNEALTLLPGKITSEIKPTLLRAFVETRLAVRAIKDKQI